MAGPVEHRLAAVEQAQPVAVGLCLAAVHWARYGPARPVPRDLLVRLGSCHLPIGDDAPERAVVDRALAWACDADGATGPLLHRQDDAVEAYVATATLVDGVPRSFGHDADDLLATLVRPQERDEVLRGLPERYHPFIPAEKD